MRVETITAALSLVAGVSGLLLAWRSHGLAKREAWLKEKQEENQHRSGLIDDLEQVLDTLRGEYDRLRATYERLHAEHLALRENYDRQQAELDQLRKEVGAEKLKRVALEERLEIEREVFNERIEILEAELKRLRNLEVKMERR